MHHRFISSLAATLLAFALGAVAAAPDARADGDAAPAGGVADCLAGPLHDAVCPRWSCSWCALEGRCAFEGDRCVAPAGPDACAKSPACALYGRCEPGVSADDGRAVCVAKSDGRCAASRGCALRGACGATSEHARDGVEITEEEVIRDAGPRCAALTDAMCKASRVCEREGLCVARGGRCVARDAAACRGSWACKTHGRCGLEDGACVVTYEDEEGGVSEACRASLGCKRLGRCTALVTDRYPAVCHGEDPDGCEASLLCTRYGACDGGSSCDIQASSGACDGTLVPVAVKAARASSEQAAGGGYRYVAAQAVDGALDTSWQPRTSKAGGLDERLTLTLAAPSRVDLVRIASGFQRTDAKYGDLFALNSRPSVVYVGPAPPSKGVGVERARSDLLDLGPVVALDAEARGWQDVWLDLLGPTSELVIDIVDVVPGERWNDPAISEVALFRCERRAK